MKKTNTVTASQQMTIKLILWGGLGIPFGWLLGVIGIALAYVVSRLIVSRVFTVTEDTLTLKKGISSKDKNIIFWVTTVVLSLVFCLGTLYFRGVMEYLSVILAYVLAKIFVDSCFYISE